MRISWLALVPAFALVTACRTYDNYDPVVDQSGLVPATQFARYGREQASVVAIGRSLSAWYMGDAPDQLAQQTAQATCFALRLPEVAKVEPDPQGHRLAVSFRSGWRAGVVPIPDGVDPSQTPGIGTLLPPPADCR